MDDFSQVPEEMQQAARWICWKRTADGKDEQGNVKYRKLPFSVVTGRGFTQQENELADMGSAVNYMNQHKYDGIGFFFGAGFCGIDLDQIGFDKHFPQDKANEIIKNLHSYTEYSPSGKGVHIIGRYSGEPLTGLNTDPLEIYTCKRYFTVTGNVLSGFEIMRDITAETVELYQFGRQLQQEKNGTKQAVPAETATPAAPSVNYKGTEEARLNSIIERLTYVRPDMLDYEEWCKVGMAIKAEGLPCAVFDEWSALDPERYRPGECEKKWNSFKGSGVTGAYITSLAKQAGWKAKDVYVSAQGCGRALNWDGNEENIGRNEKTAQIEHSEARTATETNVINGVFTPVEKKASQPRSKFVNVYEYLERHEFNADLQHFSEFKDRNTGFTILDQEMDSLYPGLYVIGAISSLGKTTFCHQMADQLASRGDDVLYFSLEQNRLEMVSKSIARTMHQADDMPGDYHSMTAINIRRGVYDDAKRKAMIQAVTQYKENIAPRMNIVECVFDETVGDIVNEIKDFIQRTGKKPIVFVDYLQIVQTDKFDSSGRPLHYTDKEKIDVVVHTLKKLQSELEIVLIVVSSFNRANYTTPVDFESFKESGGIEYTADVVWGMQLQALSKYKEFEAPESGKGAVTKAYKKRLAQTAKKKIPREIELVCLKNRYGSLYNVGFLYNPKYDVFRDDLNYTLRDIKEEVPAGDGFGKLPIT